MPQPRSADLDCQGIHTSIRLDTHGEFLEFVKPPLNKCECFGMVVRTEGKTAR